MQLNLNTQKSKKIVFKLGNYYYLKKQRIINFTMLPSFL